MATFQKNFVVKNGLEVGLNGGDTLYASSGRVGIGSTLPANTFDVTGSVGISSDLFVERTSYITDIITNNNLSVSGLSTFVGNVQLRGNLEVQGTQLIVNTEEVRIEDKNITLGFSTQIAPSDFYASGGGFEIAGSVDTSILSGIGTNSAYKSFVWYDKAYPLFVSNQRVGIGTSVATNAAYLDVGGTVQFITNEDWDLRVDGRSKFTGYTEIDNLSFSGIASLSQISVGNSLGTEFQYIRKDSTNTGLEWASFPALRTVESFTATTGQTIFTPSTSYNIGFIDVYINGVRLSDTEFVATNGTTVTLNAAAFSGDLVDLIIYAPSAGGVTSTILLQELNWQLGQVAGGIYTSGAVSIGTSESYGTLTVDGTARFSGPVSIGTTATFPTTDLIVNDDSGYPNIWLTAGPDVAGEDFRIGLTLADDGDAYLSTNDGIDLNFAVGGGVTSHVVIKEDGKVGIGTTLPSSDLHVVGDVRIVGILTVGNSSITLDGDSNTINVGSGVTITSDTLTVSNLVVTNSTSGVTASGVGITIRDGGGDVGIAEVIDFGDNLTVNYSSGIATITSTSSGVSGASYWTSTAAGIHTLSNVGIGTTNPTTKLQVGSTFNPQVIGFGTVQGYAFPSTNILIGDENTGSSLTPQVGGAWKGLNNNFIGAGAGKSTTTGTGNNFFGLNAGCSNISGRYNNFFGLYSGCSNITGQCNNFFGAYAGYKNTTGSDNFFAGYYAGFSNNGTGNVFIGNRAGEYNTTGDWNIFIGNETGRYANGRKNIFFGIDVGTVTIGCYNNFFGAGIARDNTSGRNNNFLGSYVAGCNTTGSHNNFFGAYSGTKNTIGSYNIAFGRFAAACNNTGNNNIFLGSHSGISTTASNKVIFGRGHKVGFTNYLFDSPDTTKDTQFAVGVRTDTNPSKYWLVGDENFNIGMGTTNPQTKLQVGGVIGFNDTNVRIGDNTTGANLTSGANNIFIGAGAGAATTTGSGNNFFGLYAGCSNTSGSRNFFGGYGAGANNTTGSDNIFLGYQTGYLSCSSSHNNHLGYWAGYSNDQGRGNNFFGCVSGYTNTSGLYNNFFGVVSGYSNTTGSYNNFFGFRSGLSNIIGSNNNFFGRESGYSNLNGSKNIFFGIRSGFSNETGSSNVFLGSYSGISTSASNKIILGSGLNSSNLFDSPNATKNSQFAVGLKTDANSSKYWLVGDENFNVGIGTTNPTSKLTVGGTVSATSFVGDGSALTGVVGTGSGIEVRDDDTPIGTASTINFGTGLSVSPISAGIVTVTNILSGGSAESYWTSTAAGIHTLSNVGVGTTNPQTKLEVSGVLGFGPNSNVRIGDNTTGSSLISAFNNIFIGASSGKETTDGSDNIFLGKYSGCSNTSGLRNSFIGRESGFGNQTGQGNNFFGYKSGFCNNSGNYNNFIGYEVGENNVSGCYNSAIGWRSGLFNTTGTSNQFLGAWAGRENISGSYNVYLGDSSGLNNTIGNNNIFLGSYSGISTSSSNKIIIGRGFDETNLFDSPDTTNDTQLAVGVRTSSSSSRYWIVGDENFNVGIGTTNTQSNNLQVDTYGVKTGVGTISASPGVPQDIDSFIISSTDFKTAEYTLHVGFGTYIQAQKVLLMQNGLNAYVQEYAIMGEPEIITSVSATVESGICKLQLVPEIGVSGIVTYRYYRSTLL